MESIKDTMSAIHEKMLTIASTTLSNELCEVCGLNEKEPRSKLCTSCAKKRDIELCKKNCQEILRKGGVNKRFLNCSFDTYISDTESQKTVVDYLKNITPSFTDFVFLSSSKSGTGKTHLAVATLRSVICQGYDKVRFVSSPAIFASIRETFRSDSGRSEKDVIDYYTQEVFMVIDDIGVEKITDWTLQTWYMIIDERYSRMLPTIFTSNMSIGDIAKGMDTRLASRLASGRIFTIDGKDFRL